MFITKETNYSKRGMLFEDLINKTNVYYREKNIAIIHKKPTPITVLKTNGNEITKALYSKKSTTDYNGVYKSNYIDFEAKQTNDMSFNFKRIKPHQLNHLESIGKHGGIAFLLIYFSKIHETYLIDVDKIPKDQVKQYDYIAQNYKKVPTTIHIDYISVLEKKERL